MPEIRVLVVDDNQTVRETTVGELSNGELIQVIGEAETSEQALKLGRELLPDVVLLDLHLPGFLNTIDLLKRLTALRNVKVVIFASDALPAQFQDYLDAGASGYILKSDPPALLRMSLLMVSRGSRDVISPALPKQITNLTSADRILLSQLTHSGRYDKAANAMGIPEAELMENIVQLIDRLELPGPEKLIRWAKKQGF